MSLLDTNVISELRHAPGDRHLGIRAHPLPTASCHRVSILAAWDGLVMESGAADATAL